MALQMKKSDALMGDINKYAYPLFRTNVTLRHLRCFVTVAETGSFTRAATRLFLTQSTLTTTIQQLESEVGVRLFDRTTRSVVTTPAATLLVDDASRLLKDFERMIGDLRSVSDSAQGHVKIAAASSIINWLVIPSLPHFRAAYPRVRISLREETASTVDARVLNGEVAFGIVNDAIDHPELDSVPLVRDRYGVICSLDHPLAKSKRTVKWSELQKHSGSFVAIAADTRIGAFQRYKLKRLTEPNEELSNSGSLHAMLELGGRFSVIAALNARTHQLDKFIFVPLDPPIYREISFVTRKLLSLAPSAQKLREALLQRLRVIELPRGVELV